MQHPRLFFKFTNLYKMRLTTEEFSGIISIIVLAITAIFVKIYCDRQQKKQQKEIDAAMDKLKNSLLSLLETIKKSNQL